MLEKIWFGMSPRMLWWKAIHIIAVISWMAGLLYLFRLFIYHNIEGENVVKARFHIMEKRLLFYITTPAAVLTLLTGIAMMVSDPSLLSQPWLRVKLVLVFLMLGLIHLAVKMWKRLATEHNPYKDKWLRVLNEVPTLLMIVIVFLVVFKPF